MSRRSTTLRRLHHNSLFWRFILIGFAVLMPLTGAMVQLAGEERERAIEATHKRAELLITYAVDRHNHIVEEARAILRFFGRCSRDACRQLGLQLVSEASYGAASLDRYPSAMGCAWA